MEKKKLLLTGTSGFVGYAFLKYALSKKFDVIDILRYKNKKNLKIKKLKKKYKKNYKTIFFSNNRQLKKEISKIKVDCFINFATLYKNNHKHEDIFGFIESNILFPTLIYDLLHKRTNIIINFGSMMQHSDGKNYTPKNFYASTKNAFEMIGNFYSLNNYKNKIYNLKLYESYGENDKRKKIIPTLLENYKKNKTTKILSKKLELNIVHINDIINAIMILLKNNIKPGSYCLKQNKNIKIYNLINNINKDLSKKIKVKYYNNFVPKIKKSRIKILPKWKSNTQLIKKIKSKFIHEIN